MDYFTPAENQGNPERNPTVSAHWKWMDTGPPEALVVDNDSLHIRISCRDSDFLILVGPVLPVVPVFPVEWIAALFDNSEPSVTFDILVNPETEEHTIDPARVYLKFSDRDLVLRPSSLEIKSIVRRRKISGVVKGLPGQVSETLQGTTPSDTISTHKFVSVGTDSIQLNPADYVHDDGYRLIVRFSSASLKDRAEFSFIIEGLAPGKWARDFPAVQYRKAGSFEMGLVNING